MDVLRGEFIRPSRVSTILSSVHSVSQPIFTASVHEIDSSITQFQHILSMSSRSDSPRPVFVTILAMMRHRRYTLSNQREDLDKAIVYFTESILLPPISWLQNGPVILHTLFLLANSLVMRSKVSKQPEDVIYAIKYLIHLRDQPVVIPCYYVTALLVDALALQVELEAGNVTQNIREMAALSRELLTLETSGVDTTHTILLTCSFVLSRIPTFNPDQSLDEIIEFLRVARGHRPDILECHIAFARSLCCRHSMTCRNDDYEEVTSVLDEILTYPSARDTGDESVAKALRYATDLSTGLAIVRSIACPTPEDLEEAINRTRTHSDSPYRDHSSVVLDPEAIAEQRFHYFGSSEGLGVEESFGYSPLDRQLRQMTLKSKPDFTQAVDQIKDLRSGIRNEDNTTKIDEAVKKGRIILASHSPNRTDPHQTILLNLFGAFNFEAFQRTNKIEYLNESISVHRQVIESPFPHLIRFATFPLLSHSLFLRSQHFPDHRTQDLNEAIELLSQYVNNASQRLPDRFRLACRWASSARRTRHPSVSSAYETALALMQEALLFAPTLQLQHTTLAMYKVTHSLPLDFASHRIDHYQVEEAIEVLERGRALLWSEMRHLRASTDQLLEANPELGRKFATVNRDLEELTKSVPPSHKLGKPADGGAITVWARLG
jgi:hypothetical protein